MNAYIVYTEYSGGSRSSLSPIAADSPEQAIKLAIISNTDDPWIRAVKSEGGETVIGMHAELF